MAVTKRFSMALAHEWLDKRAGGENTFMLMAKAFPQADLFALSANPAVDWDFGGRPLRTSFLDRSGVRDRRSLTLPLMPLAWESINASRYDVVMTSSVAYAKRFRPGKCAIHFSYAHAIMPYVWDPDHDRRSRVRIPSFVLRRLRDLDRDSAKSVDFFGANSRFIAEQINDYYGREAEVIYPPVETEFFTPSPARRSDYLLAVGRMVSYKHMDIAIEAAVRTGRRLIVSGWGPEEAKLRDLAGRLGKAGQITFEIEPSQDRLRALYRHAEAVVFPSLEHFGIVPVEAQACGTPVLAFGQGGATDTVIDGVTGILVPEQSSDAFSQAIREATNARFDRGMCRTNAERFGREAFIENMQRWVARRVRGEDSTELIGRKAA